MAGKRRQIIVAPNPGRRWLIGAVALFLALLLGWVVLALQLNVASAGPLPYSPLLVSRLSADYGADALPRRIASVRLTILEDAMRALGMTEAEAEQRQSDMELAMSRPVPTATALNFSGDAPFTATPTFTPVPTETSTPTVRASQTRRSPTRTPKPTKTPKPTNSPAPTSLPATPAPTSSVDSTDPVVDASGANFAPPPGDLYACTLTVDNIHITDAIGSSGVPDGRVGIKYDPGGGFIYVYGSVTHAGGFQADTSWDAVYSGTFTLTGVIVSYAPGSRMALAAPLATTSQHLNIYVFAFDADGNFDYYSIDFDYDLYVNCP